MNRDPRVWTVLGRAIRDDRNRQHLTREEVAERVVARGGTVTTRTIGKLEKGDPPLRDGKPPTLEPVVAALGWRPGDVDRILGGEDPASVLSDRPMDHGDEAKAVSARPSARELTLELLPAVFEFGRVAVVAGGHQALREELEIVAQRLVASIPGRALPDRSTYGLVAYRPHGVGESVPDDDRERIERALNSE